MRRPGRGDHFLFVGAYDGCLRSPRGTLSNEFLPKKQPPAGPSRSFSYFTAVKRREEFAAQDSSGSSEMRLSRAFFLLGCYFLVLTFVSAAPSPQEPSFELPVQLIGFPVIIAAVRISNFVKKLAYSLNPETYVRRTRRSLPLVHDEEILDVGRVEKKLVTELGNNVCVYERICAKYATRTSQKRSRERVLDWNVVFSEYKSSPDPMKENYLLSVFLGDIIGSPRLCHQLAKRGRSCNDASLSD